jgi:predicted ATPase
LLSDVRLLTLTGAAGIGKTRLALELAAEVAGEYQDGVWLAELAPLGHPQLVPLTVSAVLGVRDKPGQSLIDRLGDVLRERRLLPVLDNCEHLIQASAELAHGLLSRCTSLRILTTSREPLTVPGEHLFPVRP